jgi:hypothetical protein
MVIAALHAGRGVHDSIIAMTTHRANPNGKSLPFPAATISVGENSRRKMQNVVADSTAEIQTG